MRTIILALLSSLVSVNVPAAAVTYAIDPNHTHPMFEADHFGISTWRGLFKKTSGTITLDVAEQAGTVDVAVEIGSIDFGHDRLNDMAAHSSGSGLFEAAEYPIASYKGKLGGFVDGKPTTVDGVLSIHGITRQLALKIISFKCIANHPLLKREVCGADATGALNRADFGIDIGKQYGFKMDVMLHIQVEAIRVK
jgi:polyisoprenoid-binding protein YceI